jgi:mannose-P-dolichol utilization defect protein 1
MSEFDKFFVCVKKTLTFHLEKECLTYLLSKGLSVGMVLFSFTSKLPQILNMYKSKTVIGLSSISIYLDVICTLCSSLYPFHMGYPFLTYGEVVIVLIENLIIFLLSWKYNIDKSYRRNNLSFTLLIFSFLFICYKGILNEKSWKVVGSTSTSFAVLSKITQIIKSYKEKNTGPLSTFTFGMNMFGNVFRFYTSIKETKDYILAGSCFIAFILNLIIFLQIIYYNRNKIYNKEINNKKNKKNI